MELPVSIRTSFGKAAAKKLRAQGLVIGEVYGHGAENVHIAVPAKEFAKAFKAAGKTTVMTIFAGAEKIPAMVEEVVEDSLSGKFLHADFHRVRMDEKIWANVPVEFTGVSPAVKAGGVLVKAVAEIEVEALPAHMPQKFVVDLGMLAEIGQSVHVKDISGQAAHATIEMAPDAVVATVIAQRSDEEQAGDTRTIEDVKVETEEQKAAREKEKEAAASVEK
jgi:large subunit ribosomal protein L25